MKSASPKYFIALLLALLCLGSLASIFPRPDSRPGLAVLKLEPEALVEWISFTAAPEIAAEEQLAPRRVSLSPDLPEEPPKPAAPVPPLDAVSMRFERWPDRALLEGVKVRLVDTGRNRISQHVVPIGGRLRLANSLREDMAAILVRAEGFKPLRVTGTPRGKGIVYVARLIPLDGYFGQVVDFDGKPMAGVQVRGFWAESPRPLRDYKQADVLGSSVRERMTPAAIEDPGSSLQPRVRVPDSKASRRKETRRGKTAGDTGTLDIASTPHFLAAHAEMSATGVTDAEGWYYLKPLGGFVLGYLQLWVDGVEGASDILHVEIPRTKPRIPELIAHRPRPIVVTVLGPEGLPMEGAKVIFKLAEGWSPEWPPLTTDETGRVIFQAPSAELLVAVEKAGHKLSQPKIWRPASADRLWRQVQKLTPRGESARALFTEAYGRWSTPLPRARGFQAVDVWTSDVQMQLVRTGSLLLEVLDAEYKFPLVNAQISVKHGGLDPGRELKATDHDGHAVVRLMDREWQPMVLTISTPNYISRTFCLPPGPVSCGSRGMRIMLREATSGNSSSRPPGGQGMVLGLNGPAQAKVAIFNGTSSRATRIWSGTANAAGELHFDRFRDTTLAVFAVQTDERTGQALAGFSLGPLPKDDVMPDGSLHIQMQAPVELGLVMTALESGRPYRLEWTLRPFDSAPVMARGRVPVAKDHGGRFSLELPVPFDWILEAQVMGASVGQGPALAFTQPGFDQPYSSTRATWNAWEAVTAKVSQKASFSRRKMFLRVLRSADLSSVVLELPYYPEGVFVAAMGSAGTWYSNVSGNGWFAFRGLPIGTYKLLLYQHPDSEQGAQLEHTPGVAYGSLKLKLEQSRHDAEIRWKPR